MWYLVRSTIWVRDGTSSQGLHKEMWQGGPLGSFLWGLRSHSWHPSLVTQSSPKTFRYQQHCLGVRISAYKFGEILNIQESMRTSIHRVHHFLLCLPMHLFLCYRLHLPFCHGHRLLSFNWFSWQHFPILVPLPLFHFPDGVLVFIYSQLFFFIRSCL